MPIPSMVSFGVTARENACVELIQWHACSLVELQFTNCMCQLQGHTLIQDVQLEDMGCSVVENNMNALELEDKMRIRKSVKRIKTPHENKKRSRGRSQIEEGMAGKNKLWMRKVQPTKLGTSQQTF